MIKLITFAGLMEYRVNIFSLVLIAGIAASSIINGRSSFKSGFGTTVQESKVNKEERATWVGLGSSTKALLLKKCFSDFIFEIGEFPLKPGNNFWLLQEYFPLFSVRNVFYHHIAINGP
ncbi:MAG: hypothetical protein WD426_10090 [Anditalea sp.]